VERKTEIQSSNQAAAEPKAKSSAPPRQTTQYTPQGPPPSGVKLLQGRFFLTQGAARSSFARFQLAGTAKMNKSGSRGILVSRKIRLAAERRKVTRAHVEKVGRRAANWLAQSRLGKDDIMKLQAPRDIVDRWT